MKVTVTSLVFVIAFCGLAVAQEPPQPAEGPGAPMAPPMEARTIGRGPGMRLRGPGPGKWWKDSALMKKVGVSDEQVQEIEKIFQNHRIDLIDLHAALEKQEAILEPMVEADHPDETQVIAQIDKVAQARANLEKSNARMLLAIRRVLTVDQWKKLQDMPGVGPFRGRPEGRTFGRGGPAPGAPPEPPRAAPPPSE